MFRDVLSAASVHLLRSASKTFSRINHTTFKWAFWFVLKERNDRAWLTPTQIVIRPLAALYPPSRLPRVAERPMRGGGTHLGSQRLFCGTGQWSASSVILCSQAVLTRNWIGRRPNRIGGSATPCRVRYRAVARFDSTAAPEPGGSGVLQMIGWPSSAIRRPSADVLARANRRLYEMCQFLISNYFCWPFRLFSA